VTLGENGKEKGHWVERRGTPAGCPKEKTESCKETLSTAKKIERKHEKRKRSTLAVVFGKKHKGYRSQVM